MGNKDFKNLALILIHVFSLFACLLKAFSPSLQHVFPMFLFYFILSKILNLQVVVFFLVEEILK